MTKKSIYKLVEKAFKKTNGSSYLTDTKYEKKAFKKIEKTLIKKLQKRLNQVNSSSKTWSFISSYGEYTFLLNNKIILKKKDIPKKLLKSLSSFSYLDSEFGYFIEKVTL